MTVSSSQKSFFTQQLLDWYDPSARPLPWKHIQDPYLIWLSEIILQQTRVEQGRAYFERFKAQYPSVMELAAAPEDEVMKLWEGLGYYSRARNLHATAKRIAFDFEGHFPNTYDGILALKGVGPYTAAAIASFAFHIPKAVVDGNVYRVLARYADNTTPIDSTQGKRLFGELAQALLPADQAARYNQAIMDFGATLCTPKKPDCERCPLQNQCRSYQNGTVLERPVKAKKLKRRERHFNYLVVSIADKQLIEKRTAKDIWQNLYQYPLLESERSVEQWEDLTAHQHWPSWLESAQLQYKSGPQKQDLSHQRIIATFWEIELKNRPSELPDQFQAVEQKNLRKFAFPKIIDWYLSDNSLYLF